MFKKLLISVLFLFVVSLGFTQGLRSNKDNSKMPLDGSITASRLSASSFTLNGNDLSTTIYNSTTSLKVRINLLRSTGWYSGGLVSISTDMVSFNITAGTGAVVDNTIVSIDEAVTLVIWPAKNFVSIVNLATTDVTYVLIDKNGNIVQTNDEPSGEDKRDYILLTEISHASRVVAEYVTQRSHAAYSPVAQFQDFAESFGQFNVSGNTYYGIKESTYLFKTSGKSYAIGCNVHVNPRIPNIKNDDALSSGTISYVWRLGSTWSSRQDKIIDSYGYDTGTSSGVVLGSSWTIQTLFYLPCASLIAVQYGQGVYETKDEAKLHYLDPFQITPLIADTAVFRGWLILQRGCTDLSFIDTAEFIAAGKFGLVSAATGGTGGETNTASNVGVTDAYAIFKQKSGVDFQFNGISAASNKVTLTQNAGNNSIDIDVNETNLTATQDLIKSTMTLATSYTNHAIIIGTTPITGLINNSIITSTTPIVSLIQVSTTPIWLNIASTMTTMTEVFRSSMNSISSEFTGIKSSFTTIQSLIISTAQWSRDSANANIWNNNTGNVGIGTIAPTSKLDVAGKTITQKLFISSATAIYTYSIDVASITSLLGTEVYEWICGTYVVKNSAWCDVVKTTNGSGIELRYLDDQPRVMLVRGYINGRGTNVNDIYCSSIFLNGTKVEDSHSKRLFSSVSTDFGNLITETTILLVRGDRVGLKIANETTANKGFNLNKWHLMVTPFR